MADQREDIVELLRGRVLRGLQSGTLEAGDRLPSARDLISELSVEHRVVLAAYRQLAEEGLVEMRERGGIYVAPRATIGPGLPPVPEKWLVEMLSQAIVREIPGPDLHEWVRRCTETLRLRAAVVTSTRDQFGGLCRELRDDFGLEADGLLASEIATDPMPLPLRRADVIVTTEAHGQRISDLGREVRKPVIVIDVRPDLVLGEWALLLRRPVYAVVATTEFGNMLRRFFARVPGAANLRILVFGFDDLSAIPEDAATYVTQSVRDRLGAVRVPGRILPAARTISHRSAKQILEFIVRSNVEALSRMTR